MNRERADHGLYACPCCGYATLSEVGRYEICDICYWEDDGQDDPNEGENWGGPNSLSLIEARFNVLTVGANDPKETNSTREPEASDINLRNYKIENGKVISSKNT